MKMTTKIPPNIAPGQFWHVIYECRDTIVEITPRGNSFYALGQDGIWGLSAVAEWVKLIEIDVNASKIQRDQNDELDKYLERVEIYEEADEMELWNSRDEYFGEMNHLEMKDD
jgi:hypothetical protein